MNYKNKVQLTAIIIAPSDQAEEGDRIFQNHASWMEATHHRAGEKALLSYTVSKAQELSNPMDLKSAPTGNTCFILTEYYESELGVVDHLQQSGSWKDFPALMQWIGKCKVTMVAAAPVFNSLW